MLTFISESKAKDSTSGPNCKSGICLEDNLIALTESDIKALRDIYKKDQHFGLDFTDIRLKTILYGSVYLLTARKPNYYGIHVVLSKEGDRWIVLKKTNFVE
jgi:hypothetical protein